ncbi:bifunctional DNA primase/polymerase [Streptomyces sp. NPDC005438]|uniref:bifunctional DNA primase/polymerase n=1 Tax=Streptomyces sp. NPDC005438 TaxID=3156880 RepID=UPI00339F0AA0
MREILGRRRRTSNPLRDAAMSYAGQWRWPVLPGATATTAEHRTATPATSPSPAPSSTAAHCSCGQPDCAVPGAHPHDPVLLAATTDPAMIHWWWTRTPEAPIILATAAPVAGSLSPCAISLPAVAGAQALPLFDRRGIRVGPVVAARERFSLLVRPYGLEELGELLYAQDWVPSSLRFHHQDGYLPLPPSRTGSGQVRWERPPAVEAGRPWLPGVADLLDVLVEVAAAAPGGGSRLTY